MALKKLPHKRLKDLLALHLSAEEEPGTQRIIRRLAGVRKRGYLTKADLVTVCRWKSPRALRQIQRNHGATVRSVTRAAFAARTEEEKLACLMRLHGVGVPVASSILTLTNPSRYGVIDIRVWQLLYHLGAVDSNPGGLGFDYRHWSRFLVLLRAFGKTFDVTPRAIERTLFHVHELYQKGTLYGP